MFTPRKRKYSGPEESGEGLTSVSPFAPQGPVTALRVLGHGYSLAIDPDSLHQFIGRSGPPKVDIRLAFPSVSRVHALITRCDTHIKISDLGSKNGVYIPRGGSWFNYSRARNTVHVHVGDRFGLCDVTLLALDDPTKRIIEPLTSFCGPGRHHEIDMGLEGVAKGHMLLLHGSSLEKLRALAVTLHGHSMRRDLPFVEVGSLPDHEAQISRLLASAECGTLFIDMMSPQMVAPYMMRQLTSGRHRIWPIVATAAPTVEEIVACFGIALLQAGHPEFKICSLGLSRFAGNGQQSLIIR